MTWDEHASARRLPVQAGRGRPTPALTRLAVVSTAGLADIVLRRSLAGPLPPRFKPSRRNKRVR